MKGMNDLILYFAYGSNMNPARMARRCPESSVFGPGVLHDYRLVERRTADIESLNGGEVHGVLYRVTAADLESLDRYEGHPYAYRRMELEVESAGQTYRAFVYEMTEATRAERAGEPYSEEYRKLCSDGADFHHVRNDFQSGEGGMNTVRIIAYGTLMTGESNHFFCRNAVSIRPCTIRGALYDTGWGYPAFEPGETGTVRAELVEIPMEDWPEMDQLEGYPGLYDRRQIMAMVENETVEAWVYVMNRLPEQARIIPGGDWKNRER